MTAGDGQVEVLEKLWDGAQLEKLHTGCLKYLLFLPEQCYGFNTWCQAIYSVSHSLLNPAFL